MEECQYLSQLFNSLFDWRVENLSVRTMLLLFGLIVEIQSVFALNSYISLLQVGIGFQFPGTAAPYDIAFFNNIVAVTNPK